MAFGVVFGGTQVDDQIFAFIASEKLFGFGGVEREGFGVVVGNHLVVAAPGGGFGFGGFVDGRSRSGGRRRFRRRRRRGTAASGEDDENEQGDPSYDLFVHELKHLKIPFPFTFECLVAVRFATDR